MEYTAMKLSQGTPESKWNKTEQEELWNTQLRNDTKVLVTVGLVITVPLRVYDCTYGDTSAESNAKRRAVSWAVKAQDVLACVYVKQWPSTCSCTELLNANNIGRQRASTNASQFPIFVFHWKSHAPGHCHPSIPQPYAHTHTHKHITSVHYVDMFKCMLICICVYKCIRAYTNVSVRTCVHAAPNAPSNAAFNTALDRKSVV